MKRILLLFCLLGLFTMKSVGQTIEVPIVVVSDVEPYTVSKTVTVVDGSDVTELWMKVFNLSYSGKMSVRVNGGTWFTLTDENTEVALPEYYYGGLSGPWGTKRVAVPVTGVVTGSNTIDFRFNGTDGLSSGFRVLDFHFLRSDSSNVAITQTLVEYDPDTWTSYSTHPDSLANGEDLYYNATLTHPVDGTLNAKCVDCHTEDAIDLVYFNFENEAIVARCKFHGLTTAQCRNIASWVRSVVAPNPGRVWNPPFQPGPGIDAAPPENWSAGAGLDAVLETDYETFDEIFPTGINNLVADTDSDLNIREIRIAGPFPTWLDWLPKKHPKDLWPSFVSTSAAWDIYTNEFPALIALGPDGSGGYLARSRLINKFEALDAGVDDWREETPPESGWSVADQAQANLDLGLWHIVKVWEITRLNNLEDRAIDQYPVYGEALSFVSHARNFFNVAPHISGVGEQGNSYFTDGSPDHAKAKWFSYSWYQLQMTLNAGNRDPLVHQPVDWKYQIGHVEDITKGDVYSQPTAARIVETYIKMLQMMDNEAGIGDRGWYIRHATPYWFVRSMWGEDLTAGPQWSEVSLSERTQLANVMLRAFLEKTMEYDIADWPRGDENEQLEPATYTPYVDSAFGGAIRFDIASTIYTVAHMAPQRGIDATLLDSLAQWAESAWPLGNWEQFYLDVTYGDVTENGSISALDAAAVLNSVAGFTTLTGNPRIAADVSGNGTVSTLDASLILQRVASLIACFPVEPGCE